MGQAASAALHSSDMVALHPPSLLVLNWPFLIFSANSIPLMVTAAFSNRLNPSIGRIRCLTRRWSCSMRLFKYWLDRTLTLWESSPVSFISRTARCNAAYASDECVIEDYCSRAVDVPAKLIIVRSPALRSYSSFVMRPSNRSLDYVVAGDNAGAKADKANDLGIPILNEVQWNCLRTKMAAKP
jgi:hypothetical protein